MRITINSLIDVNKHLIQIIENMVTETTNFKYFVEGMKQVLEVTHSSVAFSTIRFPCLIIHAYYGFFVYYVSIASYESRYFMYIGNTCDIRLQNYGDRSIINTTKTVIIDLTML